MDPFGRKYSQLKELIDTRLRTVIESAEPASLYAPARFILDGGGKRIRPILVLLACEAAGGSRSDAEAAGAAVEILHNFTLVHDDIMDNAPSRRGRETVHVKWDINTAILVGDALLGIAYKTLLLTPAGDLREIVRVFTEGMIDVCEGQSHDKEYEKRAEISLDEYMLMIGKKTGTLVTMSADIGALIGRAAPRERAALADYGTHIGRAFQVQDDLLDLTGNPDTFGKIIGGDILEGKKTFLLVHALRRAEGNDLSFLRRVASRDGIPEDAVEKARALYRALGILDLAREEIRRETDRALATLAFLPPSGARDMLTWFAEMLLQREA